MAGFDFDSDSGFGTGSDTGFGSGTGSGSKTDFSTDADSDIASHVDADRLHRLLGVPELDWLVRRVAARIAAGRPAAEGTATLADPEPAQRRALERLLGRAPG